MKRVLNQTLTATVGADGIVRATFWHIDGTDFPHCPDCSFVECDESSVIGSTYANGVFAPPASEPEPA